MARKTVILGGKTFSLLLGRREIGRAVKRVAEEIRRGAKGGSPLFLCVLNGSFVFAADLLRRLGTDCEVCFVRLSSYESTSSTGNVRSIIGLDADVAGRDVIIVEDIVETGRTVQALVKELSVREAKPPRIAALFSKPAKLETGVTADYCGFRLETEGFIVGYGLDYNGMGRNLPDVYIAAAPQDGKKGTLIDQN